MDKLKQSLPAHYAPSTVNHHLALVRAVLRYALKRNLLQSIPYVPTEKVIRKQPLWYREAERDRLLEGMFEMQPRWYAFFYLTTRLGLRTGEVYAISKGSCSGRTPHVDRRSCRSAWIQGPPGHAGQP